MVWQAFSELAASRAAPVISPSDIVAWLDGYEVTGQQRRGFYFRTLTRLASVLRKLEAEQQPKGG